MLIESVEFTAKVERMVRVATGDPELQKELLQNVLLRLVKLETEEPDHTPSWFGRACRFYILDYFGEGRSIDAPKRRRLGCPIEELVGDGDAPVSECLVTHEDPSHHASMNDLLEKLGQRLGKIGREVLALLAEDHYSDRQIATRIGVSHTTVREARLQIGAVARRMGV